MTSPREIGQRAREESPIVLCWPEQGFGDRLLNPGEGLVGREADAVRAFDSPGQQPTASELLVRGARYHGFALMDNGRNWTDADKMALRILAEANADIAKVAEFFGRPETSVAWRCRTDKVKLPAAWARLIRPVRKASPRWVPLAYPYINFRRAENVTLLAVNEMVARALPGREDVCQDIMLAILEQGLTPDRATVGAFIRKFKKANYEQGGYAHSLDAVVPGTDDFRLIDTLSEADSIWNRL